MENARKLALALAYIAYTVRYRHNTVNCIQIPDP